jgi:hypothetical protein
MQPGEIMRHTVIAGAAVGLIGLAALTVPAAAHAATSSGGPTSTSFSVDAGTLSISTPDSASLGTVSIGTASVQAQLGTVTVSDQRASASGEWTASVISSAFVTGGATTAETIPASDISYNPGAATSSSGTATFTAGSPGAIDTAQTAFSAAGEVGATSVSWDPTITVTLPSAVVAGAYTGTITHSVA